MLVDTRLEDSSAVASAEAPVQVFLPVHGLKEELEEEDPFAEQCIIKCEVELIEGEAYLTKDEEEALLQQTDELEQSMDPSQCLRDDLLNGMLRDSAGKSVHVVAPKPTAAYARVVLIKGRRGRPRPVSTRSRKPAAAVHRPFRCPRCPKSFTTEGRRRCHVRYHCTGCGSGDDQHQQQKKERKEEEEVLTASAVAITAVSSVAATACPPKCGHCDQVHAGGRKRTSAAGGAKKRLTCNQCGESFSRLSSLNQHRRTTCCSQKDTANLVLDLETVSKPSAVLIMPPPAVTPAVSVGSVLPPPVPTAHVCPVCGVVFHQAGGLARHLPSHPGIRYACPLCQDSFPLRRELRDHMRAHAAMSGQARCRFCGGTFAGGSALRSHARSCSVVKPFKCRFCDKTFGILRSLEKHNRKHWTVVKLPRKQELL